METPYDIANTQEYGKQAIASKKNLFLFQQNFVIFTMLLDNL